MTCSAKHPKSTLLRSRIFWRTTTLTQPSSTRTRFRHWSAWSTCTPTTKTAMTFTCSIIRSSCNSFRRSPFCALVDHLLIKVTCHPSRAWGHFSISGSKQQETEANPLFCSRILTSHHLLTRSLLQPLINSWKKTHLILCQRASRR